MRTFAWNERDLADQHGRTIAVTGASSGIGLQLTRALTHAGATVIATVRDTEKMERLVSRLGAADVPAGRVEIRRLDVSEADSIDAFADILVRDGVALDALVNNAGVSVPTYAENSGGIELTYATNVLGPARLARRLLPLLTGAEPRVVLVGSNLSQRTKKIPQPDASTPATYARFAEYRRSKIIAAAFAVDLGERLAASGSPVRSVIAHPGVAATGMAAQADGVVTKAIAALVTSGLARPAADAARSVMWSATAPDIEQGVFVGPALRRSDARLHMAAVRGAAADAAFRARVRAVVDAVPLAV